MTATLGPARRTRLAQSKAIIALLTALVAGGSAPAQDKTGPAVSIHFGDEKPATPSLLPPAPPPWADAPESPPVIIPVDDKETIPAAATVPVVDSQTKSLSEVGFGREPWEIFPVGGSGLVPASCPNCKSPPPPNYPPLSSGPEPGETSQKPKLRDTLFMGCTSCGGENCHPGAKDCSPCCNTDGVCQRFFCNLYHCICCPDPCYEGKYLPIADSAFFTESARPTSQTRLRWDAGVDMILPDRSEYFWARADGKGRGPAPVAPLKGERRLTYHDISMYTEIGSGMLGIIFEMPYRSIYPEDAPHAANFGDMNIATKTMIFDCELLQVAMMMRTYMPVGNAGKGLGTGHVSLEPSLIVGLKLHQDAYIQGQLAEWIPLGGDPDYSGAILHYHLSFNRVLCRCLPDVPIIGTLEMNGYSFQDGAFTDPLLGSFRHSSGETYLYVGGGLRLFVCDRIDFGIAFQKAVTDEHFADQIYRTEFRFRY